MSAGTSDPTPIATRPALAAALARAPDPERASALAARLLDDLPGERVREALDQQPAALASALQTFCGVAPFLAPYLRSHPDWLFALLDEDLRAPRQPHDLADRLEETLAEASPGDEALALRRFKYFELARITWRDCQADLLPLARSGETLEELSLLADLLLDRSLSLAAARVAARFGPPRWPTLSGKELDLSFCVIALGKLGGEELNYSSDVDLVHVFQSPPDPVRLGDRPPPAEYFTRVAQEFGAIVGEAGSEGFLYRVDLDLRPEGAQGTLVVSNGSLAHYYELWADTWEKATFTKARPVAGDRDFGWAAIRTVDPMIYRTAMDYSTVQGIRELKQRFERERGGGGAGFNVKLDSGGIRDVEFVAQALQLLHAGRIPQLRSRSTPVGLERLAEVGILSRERAASLISDYYLLRRIENRLQMEAERQVHLVPRAGPACERLARAMGDAEPGAAARLGTQLEEVRARVRDSYAALLAEDGRERVLELFERRAPRLVNVSTARAMLADLAGRFAREIDASSDPERALNNLDRFVESLGDRPFYYELLIDRPELVRRLAALFASSRFLSSILASHPRLIEPIFADPELLLPSRSALRADLEALLAEGEGDERESLDRELDALRLFRNRQVLNVGLLDLGELVGRAEVERALTEVAETCLEEGLAVAGRQLTHRMPESARRGRYAVIAMGKLASRELAYGSDLDVIFLFDAPGAGGSVDLEAQEYYLRLTQGLISTLQTQTAEGSCYEIDARLRPSGNQGTLVSSLDAFALYHAESAQVWERQALLRARPVGGDPSLCDDFDVLRREILGAPLGPEAEAEIHRIRQRMEEELARERAGRHDFKTGRGGVLDVETVVQTLQLEHGRTRPDLHDVERTETQLARLEAMGALPADHARALREGWEFLQRLSHRLRIVDDRSISDLDEERGDLEGLAHRLGYGSAATGRAGGARRALLADYTRHTDAIRAAYAAVLEPEA